MKDNLQILVRNFGPIREAEFDLRPLTVFVGPSNTGKTYLAVLLYALHKYLSGDDFGLSIDKSYKVGLARAAPSILPNLDKPTKSQKSAIDRLIRSVEEESSSKKKITVPTELINNQVNDKTDLPRKIYHCFGRENLSPLFRREQKKNAACIVLEKKIQNGLHQYKCDMKLQEDHVVINSSISDDFLLPGYKRLKSIMAHERTKELFSFFYDRLLGKLLVSHIMDPLDSPTYYLPAGRTGIMNAHKVVVSSLLDLAPMEGILPARNTSTMSGVLADFLKQLIQIDASKKTKDNSIWQEIENDVLEGSVNIKKTTVGYPDFTYRPSNWLSASKTDVLPLMNTSSMVSELAPVVLYLKHLINRNDILIVEEPESHLHPEMQVEFTKKLVALVDKGINVLVTTHSDWILEELTNIVYHTEVLKNKTKKSERAKKRADFISLSKDNVGIWSFQTNKRQKGSKVEEIKLVSGSYLTGYEKTTEKLHNDWASITGLIKK